MMVPVAGNWAAARVVPGDMHPVAYLPYDIMPRLVCCVPYTM